MPMYRYAEANPLRRIVRQAASTRPMAWLFARILHRIDGVTYRATRGRTTASMWSTGLPMVMLTTTGARTGQPRTVPVVGIPHGDQLVLIASNYGQQRHPAWYHNIRAQPAVSVAVHGVTREYVAHELAGAERESRFEDAIQVHPGWLHYQTWAGDRQIPVILLDPVTGKPMRNDVA
jgi:deazaflavin-dependent oxidoreductase (nitroreductase family)